MQKKQILATIAVALIAISANAGTPIVTQAPCADIGVGPYIGVQGGVNFFTAFAHPDAPTQISKGEGIEDITNNSTKSSVAGFAGLKLGYTFKTDALVRPALEYDGYWVQARESQTSILTDKRSFSPGNSDNTVTDQTVYARANTFANMINGIARFDLGSFQPYAGIGIGAATTDVSVTGKGTSTEKVTEDGVTTTFKTKLKKTDFDNLNGSSSTYFAVQAIAGADYYFASNMSVFAEYKFLNVCGDQGMNNLRNNIVGAGVRFHF